MKIGFGCDHAAIDLKNELIEYMTEKGYECVIQTRVVKLVKQL